MGKEKPSCRQMFHAPFRLKSTMEEKAPPASAPLLPVVPVAKTYRQPRAAIEKGRCATPAMRVHGRAAAQPYRPPPPNRKVI